MFGRHSPVTTLTTLNGTTCLKHHNGIPLWGPCYIPKALSPHSLTFHCSPKHGGLKMGACHRISGITSIYSHTEASLRKTWEGEVELWAETKAWACRQNDQGRGGGPGCSSWFPCNTDSTKKHNCKWVKVEKPPGQPVASTPDAPPPCRPSFWAPLASQSLKAKPCHVPGVPGAKTINRNRGIPDWSEHQYSSKDPNGSKV